MPGFAAGPLVPMPFHLSKLAGETYCYLTTTGRVSRLPRTIEIWFALDGATLYMLSGSGDRADWVKNALLEPRVAIKIGEKTFPARARLVTDSAEDALARRLLLNKYAGDEWARRELSISDWAKTSLPVAFELGETVSAPSASSVGGRGRTNR